MLSFSRDVCDKETLRYCDTIPHFNTFMVHDDLMYSLNLSWLHHHCEVYDCDSFASIIPR